MAATKRDPVVVDGLPDPLADASVGFFWAVRALEQLTPSAPRVGEDGPLSAERLYFRHSESFSSQPSEIRRIEWTEVARDAEARLEDSHRRFEITTAFLGLTGADSPMPLYIAAEMLGDEDESIVQRRFLDCIHNRVTALFYRGVAKYHYPWEFESSGADMASTRVLALEGIDAEAGIPTGVTRPELLRLASLFALGPDTGRSVREALTVLLRPLVDGAPVELTQFTGGWVHFEASQTNLLGRRNNEAARTFVIGTRIRHPAHRAKITIGPVLPAVAERLEPPQPGFEKVRSLVRAMCGEPVEFDLELMVEEGGLPPFVLGQRTLGRDVCVAGRPKASRVVSRVFALG